MQKPLISKSAKSLSVGTFKLNDSMNLLLGLHQSVLEPILSDWLQASELCLLDTAVCCSETRSYFLTMLSSALGNDNELMLTNYDCFYDWISLRRIRLRHITLTEAQCISPSPALLKLLSSEGLTELTTPICDGLFSLIRTYRLRIRRLKVLSHVYESEALKLLKLLGPTLETLNLQGGLVWSRDAGQVIAKLCPHLTVCDILGIDLSPVLAKCPIRCMTSVPFSWMTPDGAESHFRGDLEASEIRDSSALVIGSRAYRLIGARGCGTREEIQFLAPYLRHVRKLELEGDNWSVLRTALSHCTSVLTSLEIRCNSLEAASLKTELEKFPLLEELGLSGVTVNNSVLQVVAQTCPTLTNFVLNGTHVEIDENTLRYVVKECHCLRYFELQQDMDESVLYGIATDIQDLTLEREEDCYFEKSEGRFQFSSSTPIANSAFRTFFEQNCGLRRVEIIRQPNLDNESLKQLMQLCPLLEDITIVRCEGVTTEGLYAVADNKQLKKLNYMTYHVVNKISLKRLLTGLNMLESLCLPYCCDLQGEELQWIAKCCPLITEVVLTLCVDMEDKHIMPFIEKCPNLVSLDVRDCCCLSAAVLSSLKGRVMRRLRLGGTRIERTNVVGLRCKKDFDSASEVGSVDDYDEEDEDDEDDVMLSDEEESNLFDEIVDSGDSEEIDWFDDESDVDESVEDEN